MNPDIEHFFCPTCGQTIEYKCEAEGCNTAEWEGWWRVADGFGIKTGIMQRRKVCQHHRYLKEINNGILW